MIGIKENVIEVLGDFPLFPSKMKEQWMPQAIEKLADHLISNSIIALPLKVGDTVWIVGDKFPAEIARIIVDKDGISFEYVEYDRGYDLTELWDDGTFTLEEIGKTVFLTQEESERRTDNA